MFSSLNFPGGYFVATFLAGMFMPYAGNARSDTTTYHLIIKEETVYPAGKKVTGMTVNGSIPGPVLEFNEGGYAVIEVENQMDVETSVHWHGLILPNYFDGVPYLTTPPIRPGETFRYEFPLQQAGTYWYHSHTMFQEQRGVYGGIIIHPREKTTTYDRDVVVLLSDWTNENPYNVMRNLKRGNEWYGIRKGTSVPLSRVIARGALGSQLNFWRQRMEGADIADVYYPAFLSNGSPAWRSDSVSAGERIRLRVINSSASSQYWLTFGGNTPSIISADGLDVVPVKRDSVFIAIAETYDFLVDLPKNGIIEMRAMAQDGSGVTSAYFGEGDTLKAKVLQRPDKISMMEEMAQMKMRMGAPAIKFRPSKEEPYELRENWGMKMEEGDMQDHDMSHMHHMESGMNSMSMDHMKMFDAYNYDYLKAPESTAFKEDTNVKELLFNLTGNMWRYIWNINGVPLSASDKIMIKKGEIVRITLNNLTMMHHPMHLHGHFFRVINKNGVYSPLKHTVNVPPMEQITIEFDASESGDWFFHCHVLYHMSGGMARFISYGTPRDERMEPYDVGHIKREDKMYYSWGTADVASHMSELSLVSSNARNLFMLTGEYGWNENLEAEVTYEYFLYDYLSVFGGINTENEKENSMKDIEASAIAGIRFFTPYMMMLDVRLDDRLRPQIGLSREVLLFPRTMIFGEVEYQADFGVYKGVVQEYTPVTTYRNEIVWTAGAEYMLSRNFSLMVSYDNRFGAGGGISSRF